MALKGASIMGMVLVVAAAVAIGFEMQQGSPPDVAMIGVPEKSPTPTHVPLLPVDARTAYAQQKLFDAGFSVGHVLELFGDSRLAVYPPEQVTYKKPDWAKVERRMYNAAYVQKGKNYLAANKEAFEQAEEFGVPKEIIAGLIATETDFGEVSGTKVTFNVLYSRMEQWPEEKWRGQADLLVALSMHCLEHEIDCFGIKGSYAGAIGIVQFMPDSLRTYGIDGDGDGLVDLFDPIDAIPSAANFLKEHGWEENHTAALAKYYGSSVGYPRIVSHYASLLMRK